MTYQAIRNKGAGVIDHVAFEHIKYQVSGSPYAGAAVAYFSSTGGNLDVTNSTFADIGREGVLYFGAGVTGTFQSNVYTGKGLGDWLDYAVEAGAGAVIDVIDNDISQNLGTASSDGSTSAGVLATTYFGAGTEAHLTGNNTIHDNLSGVAVGYDGTDTSVVTIDGASITDNTDSGVVITGGSVSITNDTAIAGNGTGVLLLDGMLDIENNDGSIHGNTVGVDVAGGSATIANNHIYDNTTGIRLSDGGTATIDDNNFEGDADPDNGTDLRLDATAGLIIGGAIAGNTFAGTTYIDNRSSQDILALIAAPGNNVYKRDNATVETVNANIESRVYHTVDDSASGLVTWVANTIVVTPATTPTPTDNDYTRIKNAIEAAGNGYTVDLQGTFHWDEANAMASWALGNDSVASTPDDYTISVPALDHLTITASGGLGSARIQGPGDLAGADLESVFYFNSATATDKWQYLTVSNLEIFDFDWSIGMDHNGGPTDAFSHVQILNNHLRIANDLNDVAAPADQFQNIGIHYSFGTNQTIQGNQIDIPGDGVSDPSADLTSNRAAFSSVVGIQSNTSGGAIYDGLLIDSNVITVLHAQDATNPQRIIGIWENGHAHTSNITVSNNQFVNDDVANDPTANLQQAFWITSHSSSSTTVSYTGNTVDGASVGFKWIGDPEYPGTDFSGHDAVVLSGNALTNVNVGFLVQSNGQATLSGNTLTNTGTMEHVGTGVDVASGSTVTLDGSSSENTIVGFATGVHAVGTVTVSDNDASIHGNLVGVDVDGGSASVTSNHIYDNTTGIRFANGGTGSVTSNTFSGTTENGTDLFIASDAGTVTIGANNAFAGDTFYIDNQSTQDYDLSSNGTMFAESDNFRIEDKIHHRMDTDLSVTNGLVTWVADTLFVTDAGTDHSIAWGVAAASDYNTLYVEDGTYNYAAGVLVDKPLTILGAQYGVDATTRSPVAESSIQYTGAGPAGAFDIKSDHVKIDGFYFDAPSRAITTTGGSTAVNDIQVLNNIVAGGGSSTLYAFMMLRVGSGAGNEVAFNYVHDVTGAVDSSAIETGWVRPPPAALPARSTCTTTRLRTQRLALPAGT